MNTRHNKTDIIRSIKQIKNDYKNEINRYNPTFSKKNPIL